MSTASELPSNPAGGQGDRGSRIPIGLSDLDFLRCGYPEGHPFNRTRATQLVATQRRTARARIVVPPPWRTDDLGGQTGLGQAREGQPKSRRRGVPPNHNAQDAVTLRAISIGQQSLVTLGFEGACGQDRQQARYRPQAKRELTHGTH